uniref:Uncharacterized protein n=1 Tax=Tanacetum cinerariifolium TaxID=118510 RepID=A0A6L2J9I2_TANCI|nr:hypothetical protein [Tanacetum cinerariifolium]
MLLGLKDFLSAVEITAAGYGFYCWHSVQPVEARILADTPKPTSPKTSSSGKRKNRETCFVCRSVDHLIKDCNYHAMKKAQPTPRNYVHTGTHKQNASFTHHHPQMHMVPAAVLTQSKPISTAVRPIYAAVPKIMVTRPRHAHSIDTKSKSTFRRHITHGQSPKISNSTPRVTAAQTPVVNATKGKKEKWNNIDAAQPKLMLLVYMVTAADVNKEVSTDN